MSPTNRLSPYELTPCFKVWHLFALYSNTLYDCQLVKSLGVVPWTSVRALWSPLFSTKNTKFSSQFGAICKKWYPFCLFSENFQQTVGGQLVYLHKTMPMKRKANNFLLKILCCTRLELCTRKVWCCEKKIKIDFLKWNYEKGFMRSGRGLDSQFHLQKEKDSIFQFCKVQKSWFVGCSTMKWEGINLIEYIVLKFVKWLNEQ